MGRSPMNKKVEAQPKALKGRKDVSTRQVVILIKKGSRRLPQKKVEVADFAQPER